MPRLHPPLLSRKFAKKLRTSYSRACPSHKVQVHFQTGAGIVADSIPEAEYEETAAKAAGFTVAVQG